MKAKFNLFIAILCGIVFGISIGLQEQIILGFINLAFSILNAVCVIKLNDVKRDK